MYLYSIFEWPHIISLFLNFLNIKPIDAAPLRKMVAFDAKCDLGAFGIAFILSLILFSSFPHSFLPAFSSSLNASLSM